MKTNSIPRPEYPNPQFERKQWINLNGKWDFYIDYGNSGKDRKIFNKPSFDESIVVPFCMESKLSGIEHHDFAQSVWYKKRVNVESVWTENGRRTFLHFGASDYETEAFINGESVGIHYGGYSSFSFDITKYIKSGENDITVRVFDDNRSGKQPRGKQASQFYSSGCDYTRTTGIWQTVWLESTPNSYIKSAKFTPSLKNGTLFIEAETNDAAGKTLTATAFFDGKEVASESVVCGWARNNIVLKIQEPHAWELENPALYELVLGLEEDTVYSYFGLRDIELKDRRFYLNGKPVFQRLILDQGFYPDGLYTAPTEQELIADIERSKAMGFNGARLHQKIFEPRFLYHCDRMGYIVWEEHANWGFDCCGAYAYEGFVSEWLEIMQRDVNHPSIIGWCPLNETSRFINQKFVRYLYSFTKAYDSTRLFIDNSGWFHVDGTYDMYDVHDYCDNTDTFRRRFDKLARGEAAEHLLFNEPRKDNGGYSNAICFISEFGGKRMANVDSGDWGYGEAAANEKEFIEYYDGLCKALLNNPAITAFCYTQLTDIEQECNGLYTYDRKPKVNVKAIHDITSYPAAIEREK